MTEKSPKLPRSLTDQLNVGRGRHPSKRVLAPGADQNAREAEQQAQRVVDALIRRHKPLAAEVKAQNQMLADLQLLLGTFIAEDDDLKRQKHGLLITGPRGLGKSTLVRRMLKDRLGPDYAKRVFWIAHQELTTENLFYALKAHPDAMSILVFDDCDGVWDHRPLLQLLNAALETEKERIISYRPRRAKLSDPRPEPVTEKFRGRIVIVTNEDPEWLLTYKPRMKEHVGALTSRMQMLDFDIITPLAVLANALERIREGMLADILDGKQLTTYITWLTREHARLDLNLRNVRDMAGLFRDHPIADAKRLAMRTGRRRETRRQRRMAAGQ